MKKEITTFKDIVIMLGKSKHVRVGSRVMGSSKIIYRDEKIQKKDK